MQYISFLKKILFLVIKVYKTAQLHGYPLFRSYWQFYKLSGYGMFSPGEIFSDDLLNPALTPQDFKYVVSCESFLRYQCAASPADQISLTEDKEKFHYHCIKHNLPVPDLIAVIKPQGNSSWGNGKSMSNEQDFVKGLADYPFDVVCKPIQGAHGKKVTNLHFVNGEHILFDFPEISLAEFAKSIFSEVGHGYIVQQKLYSHRELEKFSGNPLLQTMRIETCLDDNNQPKLLGQLLKLVPVGNITDNTNGGENNNRECKIDENGLVYNSFKLCPDRQYFIKYDYVESAAGEKTTFQIPQWQECLDIILKAQMKFSPLKSIGWDLAITDDGPFLIEGNAYWDPPGVMSGEERCKNVINSLDIPLERRFGVTRYKETE